MKKLSNTELKRLHREWRRTTEGRVGLLLDGVQGPFNLGSILRTAAAYRVEHLWLAGTDTTPDSEKVGKTSLGSERFVDWTLFGSAGEAAALIASQGFELVGVELAEGADPIHEAEFDAAVCLALGNEDRGLSQSCLEACDRVVYIPQLGRIGSLNVATAAALAIWELRRRQIGTSAN